MNINKLKLSIPEHKGSSSLEEQEHLSFKRLKSLQITKKVSAEVEQSRPQNNYIQLMNWAVTNFGDIIPNTGDLNKFVHNRIVIDGPFLKYCEENKVKIIPIYKDSIISWKSEHEYEKFFAQGIFHIKGAECEFLLGSLFIKGNQYEDEITFFVICSDACYEKYISFRNKYDEWLSVRDRNNLFIHVIDGEDIPYTRDNSWDDLFLPDEMKSQIKSSVENFLSSEDFYAKNKIPWKRGLLLYGPPGTGKTSAIKTIISNYNFKPVTIAPGAPIEAVQDAFAYAEQQSPSLLYFEDLDSMLQRMDSSAFLNLMDGINATNGIFIIATANDVKKLKTNITDRPSRFDRKFEYPLPDQKMILAYLQKWFGDILNAEQLKKLAKDTSQYHFSYAYLKEFYISSMFEALSNNRKVPLQKDIKSALDRLIKDKNALGGQHMNMDRYL